MAKHDNPQGENVHLLTALASSLIGLVLSSCGFVLFRLRNAFRDDGEQTSWLPMIVVIVAASAGLFFIGCSLVLFMRRGTWLEKRVMAKPRDE